MAYNKAKEEYRWNQWKAEEEKILREQGVEEEMIQKLREYDWEDFKAERRFREHQTSLLDCMELPEQTVYTRLRRLREKIRKSMRCE